MPLSPVRSLQRGSRPIGPVYNDANRSARKLKRQGFNGAAERVALQGAAEQLARGGSNITSAESNRDERDAAEVVQRGLMRGRRDASLSPDSGLTVEATGDTLAKRQGLYERMRSGVTPEMRKEAAGLGVTDSGFAQASSRAAQNPLAPTQSIARGVSEPVEVKTPALTPDQSADAQKFPTYTPIPTTKGAAPALGTLTRPAADTALPTRETSPRTFAERDAVMKSAMAASADGTTSRTRQDVVDEANKARIAEGKIPFNDSIYSEMSKLDVANRDAKSKLDRSGFGKAFNVRPQLQRPGLPMPESRDGPLVNYKDLPEEEARKRRMKPALVGGVEVPGLGVGDPTPKFKLRR